MNSFFIRKVEGNTTGPDLSQPLPIGKTIIFPSDTPKESTGPSLELLARENYVKVVVRHGRVVIMRNQDIGAPYSAGYGTHLIHGNRFRIQGFGAYAIEYRNAD